MTVQDDLRRLSQVDSIFLGWSTINAFASPVTSWYKGRVQQAADGNWIFRSLSQDGSVIGYQLGSPTPNWSSGESPSTGIIVTIPIAIPPPPGIPPIPITLGNVILQQQLPPELTN
jgi:hypothetical protein